MAHILQQNITISISKLVRTSSNNHSVLTDEQLQTLLDTLPSVVEQVLDDPSLVVEALHD